MGYPQKVFVTDNQKLCTKCQQTLPISEFWKDATMKCGYFSWCKTCTRGKPFEVTFDAEKNIKKCVTCDEWKPTTEFHNSKAIKCKFSSNCKTCKRKQYDKRKKNNKFATQMHFAKKLGISLDKLNIAFENQNGCCAICKQPETTTHQNGTLRNLAIDHDHETGEFRGLLCSKCNIALGGFKDDLNLLKSAVEYLSK